MENIFIIGCELLQMISRSGLFARYTCTAARTKSIDYIETVNDPKISLFYMFSGMNFSVFSFQKLVLGCIFG